MKQGIKTEKEIEIMRRAGKLLGEVLDEVLNMVKPGVTELELDSVVDNLITKKGGFPGFKKVHGYKHATCISINEEVVHGIPKNRKLKEGDVVCIDSGVYLEGLHTDMAETILVQSSNFKIQSEEIEKFLGAGKRALWAGIEQARSGNRVGHISKAIQNIIEKESGYSIVRSLVGHGVGRDLHEDPQIPGRLEGKIDDSPKLESGMTLAIEVIYNMGGHEVEYEGSDDWTIIAKDSSISAVFERTIVITEIGPELLTAFPGESIPPMLQ